MTYKIFIDGEEGTTGLQIRQRLERRPELSLIHLPNKGRKDPGMRREAFLAADVGILCLPDSAAREVVSFLNGANTKLIDASTAHRVSDNWVYGFPELNQEQKGLISSASRVTNPGCYSTAAIALLRPLVSGGIIPVDYPVTINAISGYSGGGKTLIARMEDATLKNKIRAEYFAYGLSLEHKHIPEIVFYSGLNNRPVFVPSVGRFRQGMVVQIPLQLWSLQPKPSVKKICNTLKTFYSGQTFVSVANEVDIESRLAFLDPEELNNTNRIRLFVFSNEEYDQIVLTAQLDNLGKGAAGQAIQNLNLMLGLPETSGLEG